MNLLLEIGAEEIPDWMLGGALEYLGGALERPVQTTFARRRFDPYRRHTPPPRRSLRRHSRPETRRRRARLGTGQNRPARRHRRFCQEDGRGAGSTRSPLRRQSGKIQRDPRKIPGRSAGEILADALPQLILKTPFPKTMYWTGKGGVRFIRPIRWIVAMLDNEVIPFEIAGVPSGNESSGHRKLGAARFPVTFENYEAEAARQLRHPLSRRAPRAHPRSADEI